MFSWLGYGRYLLVFLVSALALQSIPNDEIRWGARPYSPSSENSIRVRSELVEVGVVVRDSRGKPVRELTQSDFEIFDNGKPQKISIFSIESAPEPISSAAPAQPPSVHVPVVSGPPPKPRFIAFYFDDFNMPEGDLAFARKAAEQFIREDLQTGDRIGVFTSSTSVYLDFTSDREKLVAALQELRTHQRRPDQGPGSCPRMGPYQAWLITQFYNVHSDAFDLALKEAMTCGRCSLSSGSVMAQGSTCAMVVRAQAQETVALAEQFSQDTLGIIGDVVRRLEEMPGYRMLVLASSGFLTQTVQQQQDKVIDEALRAGVVINSLDAKGLSAETPGGDLGEGRPILTGGPDAALKDGIEHQQKEFLNDPLALLAEGTGGRFFHNSNDLRRGYREMAGLPEVSYVLGFSPSDLKTNGSFHELKVKLPRLHDSTIQARRGYFASSPPKPAEIAVETMATKLNQAVSSTDLTSELAATLNTQSERSESGGQTLKVSVHVDARSLPFRGEKGRHVEKLIFVTALFDSRNQFLKGVEGVMDLNLKDTTFGRLSAEGLDAHLSLQAPPGNYRLRQVIQEDVSGRLASMTIPVEIH